MPTGEANTFPPAFLPSRPTLAHYAGALHAAEPRARVRQQPDRGDRWSRSVSLARQRHGRVRLREAPLRRPGSPLLGPARRHARSRRRSRCCRSSCSCGRSGSSTPTPASSCRPSRPILGIFLIRQFAHSIPDDLLDAARAGRGGRAGDLPKDRPAAPPARADDARDRDVSLDLERLHLAARGPDRTSRATRCPSRSRSSSASTSLDTELMMAGSVLTVLPVLLLFLALQTLLHRRHPDRRPQGE